MHAAQAAEWPAIADIVDALRGAAEYMAGEGKVVFAKPGRDRPLHTFGTLDEESRHLRRLLQDLPEVDNARWLFLGGYGGA
eukprot:gene8154-19088_t